MKKTQVIDAINEMPSDFDLEDLIEKLIFVDKVEKGLEQAREGKVTPHEQVKKEVKGWSK